jgi:hypothetical protein
MTHGRSDAGLFKCAGEAMDGGTVDDLDILDLAERGTEFEGTDDARGVVPVAWQTRMRSAAGSWLLRSGLERKTNGSIKGSPSVLQAGWRSRRDLSFLHLRSAPRGCLSS